MSQKYLHTKVYWSTIHNNLVVEPTWLARNTGNEKYNQAMKIFEKLYDHKGKSVSFVKNQSNKQNKKPLILSLVSRKQNKTYFFLLFVVPRYCILF